MKELLAIEVLADALAEPPFDVLDTRRAAANLVLALAARGLTIVQHPRVGMREIHNLRDELRQARKRKRDAARARRQGNGALANGREH
jgi:hypothetical protein